MADILFPGTTTIQTRARYFLFIPWIYTNLERRQVTSAQIAGRARAAEIALIEPLADDDRDGVIGIDARARLKRLPSSVYWQGLGSWGLRLYPGSQDQYHRSLDGFYRSTSQARRNDDGELPDGGQANWDPAMPPAPDGFPEVASLALRPEESEYLRDRIVLRHPGTLLAALTQVPPWQPQGFAWLHPAASDIPPQNQRELHHARCFSELLHGVQLLYNLMLSEKTDAAERIDDYRLRLLRWQETMVLRWSELEQWARHERDDFWQLLAGAKVPPPTRCFVDQWLERVLAAGPATVADDETARRLVHHREVRLKRKMARLENPVALSLWGGAAGASQLDMRWGITQRLLGDILLGEPGADA